MLSSTWEQTRRSFQGLGTFQVRGSEDAMKLVSGDILRDVFLWPSCPFQYACPNLGQTFVNMIESISSMPLRISKSDHSKKEMDCFSHSHLFFSFLFLGFFEVPKNP